VGLDPLVAGYREFGIDDHAMEYVEGRSEDMPFPDASFDVITSINSLDHVDDLDRTLAEVTRVLVPGGELLVLVHIHRRPTIAEPVHVPWDLADRINATFERITEHHYELSPAGDSALRAMHDGIPYDHTDQTERYGALVLRLRRR
jgi:SAM-dependent methyltransferase